MNREPEKNLHAAVAPAPLLAQAQEVAQQDHISLDELAATALERHLARRMLERFRSAGELRRGAMSDDEIADAVANAVQEHRRELRTDKREQ